MPKYEMVIRVESADDMALIVQACKGSAELITTHKIEETKPKRKKPVRKTPGIANNPKAVRGEDLLRTILADGKTHTVAELKKTFIKNGFAADSYSPNLARLGHNGEVKRTGEGEWTATAKFSRLINSAEGHSK